MMMLGLVIHAALTYNVTQHGDEWPLRDPQASHIFCDSIVFLIHIFRMPIFFLIAGFFGALLFYEKGGRKMAVNRLRRIVFPFIVFLFLLWPLTVFSFEFSKASFLGLEMPAIIAFQSLSNLSDFLPQSTFHLWFLYYLIGITATIIPIALILRIRKEISFKIYGIFDEVISRPFLRILIFSLITFALLYLLGTSMITASMSLIPDLNTFLYFLFFYLVGWLTFKSRHHLETFKEYDKISFLLAVILVTIKGGVIQKYNLPPGSHTLFFLLISSLAITLFLFSITGLFIRYSSKYNSHILYMSNASYWVYLIHLPIAAILPAFIWTLPLPAIFKFLIVCLTTALICIVSYHYFVRSTFIGKFLNGRKF